MADRKISELVELTGALNAADALAIADDSASQTKKISPKALIEQGVQIVADSSIPLAKVDTTSLSLTLADRQVTAAKLDDNSSGVVTAGPLANGIRIGQVGINSTDNKFYVWSGSAWIEAKAAGSINSVTGDTTGILNTNIVQTGDSAQVVATHDNTTAAAQFLAGPTSAGGAVQQRVIVGDDLPTASATEKGAVKVNGSGLKVDGGVLKVDNTVAPSAGTFNLCDVDANGLVIDYRTVQGSDLPVADAANLGAVKPGTDLTVDVSGFINHIHKLAAPGTYTKVTCDGTGHVTNGESLAASDIPALDASKITTGAFPTALLADHSVTALKLADYSTAYIQDTKPADTGNTIGQLWLNPLAQQIRMWDGNVWVPIGVGALSEQNLRFCGLFDATNGKIKVVTKLGLDSGFKVGDVIPTMTDQLTGAYFVCDTPGNAVGQLPGITFDAGDWIVGISVAVGWERVDTLNGGGGGGGASTLDSLTDVTLTTPGAGQVLTYNGVLWQNTALPSATDAIKGIIEIATQAEVDAGTDATRAVVPSTLKSFVNTAVASGTASNTAPSAPSAGQVWVDTSKSPPVMNVWDGAKWVAVGATPADASETVKGIAEIATQSEVNTGTDDLRFVTPLKLATYVAANAPTPADASETVKGIVELATAAETTAGTSSTRAVHPAGLKVELDKKAPLASPALTGTPTAPTATAGTSTTQLATTAFVGAAVTAAGQWGRNGTNGYLYPKTLADKVGIGTNTPAKELEVSGTIRATVFDIDNLPVLP